MKPMAGPRRVTVRIAGEELTLRELVATVAMGVILAALTWLFVVFAVVLGTPA